MSISSKSKSFEEYFLYFSNPPTGLDTWGLDPIDYRLNQDLHLIRRYPSPLTHFGLSSRSQKQKKVFSFVFYRSIDSKFDFFSRTLSYRAYQLSQHLL